MASGVNLDLLPPLTLITSDSIQDIVDDIAKRAAFENASPSDPVYRNALASAYRERLLRQDADEQAKGLMLAFARGSELDHIGTTYYRTPDGKPVHRLDGEADEDYRYRLHLSPEGFSVAGPEDAYKFYVRSVSSDVRDVYPHSPSPAVVDLYIFTYSNNGIPTEEFLKQVPNDIGKSRPIADFVTAKSIELLTFTVTAVLWVPKGADLSGTKSAALTSVALYLEQEHKLAGFVTSSSLDKYLTVGDVKKVDLVDWQNIKAERHQVPSCQVVNVEVKELE